VKIEVEHVNPDRYTLERWTGEGALEAALGLVEEDWDVLAIPADVAAGQEIGAADEH
jgi:hypothetical protein